MAEHAIVSRYYPKFSNFQDLSYDVYDIRGTEAVSLLHKRQISTMVVHDHDPQWYTFSKTVSVEQLKKRPTATKHQSAKVQILKQKLKRLGKLNESQLPHNINLQRSQTDLQDIDSQQERTRTRTRTRTWTPMV